MRGIDVYGGEWTPVVLQPDRRGSAPQLAIWLAFAGAIVAACIGGAFTIAAAFIDGGGDGPPPPAPSADAPAAPSAEAPGDGAIRTGPPAGSTTAGSPDAGAGQPAVRVRGKIVLQVRGASDKVVLDAVPLRKGEPFQPGDFAVWSITASGKAWIVADNISNTRLALWEADNAPSYIECREASRGQGRKEVYPAAGDRLCAQTHEGRTAMVHIRSVNRAEQTVSADVTVWDPTA